MAQPALKLLLAATCWLVSAAAQAITADDIATHLGARLENSPVLRAEFVQTKELAAFKKPVLTRGQLVFARQDGVLWQIEQPLKLTYVLGETRITEIGDDGQVVSRAVNDVPAMAQVGRILRALLGAQLGPLREWFEASAEGNDKQWTLILTPKSPQVGQFIRRITLGGSQFVDTIAIEEKSGDTARIRFRQISEGKTLSKEERSLFDLRPGAR